MRMGTKRLLKIVSFGKYGKHANMANRALAKTEACLGGGHWAMAPPLCRQDSITSIE